MEAQLAAGGASDLCRGVVEAVQRCAAQVIIPRFLAAVRRSKDDGSLFSEADLAAQSALAASLTELVPGPFLGEEMSAGEQRETWRRGSAGLWCVDPIDGTTNFLNGIPVFAVAVAWVVGGRARIGVVYNPASGEAFYAEAGCGAWLNGVSLPLRRPARGLADCVAGVDFKRIGKQLADSLATAPPFYSQRNFGSSALEWCYVAAGRFDVYVHGGQKLWDYCAGRLILEEAGGRFCTLAHDDFDADDLWKRSVVAAATPELFAAWRDWIRLHQ